MTDLRELLSQAIAYRLFNALIGAPGAFAAFTREHVRSQPNDRVLDIGCGPGSLRPYLMQTEYVGVDISEAYIQAAEKKYGRSARFLCADVGMVDATRLGEVDLVVSYGVLHHLADDLAVRLFEVAWQCLRPGGRLVTCDGVFAQGQSRTARWLLSRDRGCFVRTEREYVRLAKTVFGRVDAVLHSDLLRIPYTHLVMECVKCGPAQQIGCINGGTK